jgi:cysteinyl-tRNA synthetase
MSGVGTIKIYNTMTGVKQEFQPLQPGKAGIYVCGPTVYSFVHIGNMRTFTTFDTIVRYLRYRGFQVRYVRNYTDVDDKIINAAKETGEDPIALAARFVREFEADAKALHLIPPDVSPKVSETIPEIISIIEKLVANGVAYPSQGDVYFQVSKYPQYAGLSHRKLDDLKSGARVEPGEAKREPLDFALWKGAKPGEPSWDSPWGKGRPGWHIECSAMSGKFLGDTFDLHGGALDLIFPHHENEKAQSEAASGKTLCNCWMHAGFLDLEGAKMSKSLGNVVRARDALQRVDAEALRYFFLSTHYRAPLAFGDKSLADAEARMEYFYETLRKANERPAAEGGAASKWLEQLEKDGDDDFNFAGGLSALSGLFAEMNSLLDAKDKAAANKQLTVLKDSVKKVSSVLGLFEDDPAAWLLRRRERRVKEKGLDAAWVDAKIQQRNDARKAKDFAKADGVRNELKAKGVEIMDTPQGTTWKVAPDEPVK